MHAGLLPEIPEIQTFFLFSAPRLKEASQAPKETSSAQRIFPEEKRRSTAQHTHIFPLTHSLTHSSIPFRHPFGSFTTFRKTASCIVSL